MLTRDIITIGNNTKRKIRICTASLLLLCTGMVSMWYVLLSSKDKLYEEAIIIGDSDLADPTAAPFPIGVNPRTKTITENTTVDDYVSTHLSIETAEPTRRTSFIREIQERLVTAPWYQNVASPLSRILIIRPGYRKEQVVKQFGDILGWNDTERERFSELITSANPELPDGTFFPDTYMVTKDATPEDVATLVHNQFLIEILNRYGQADDTVPIADAIIIASLLEREAYDFNDMRYISGIIWNRLFIDMRLQLDATLQYAKGSQPTSPVWWPQVVPQHKYIDSPYNTYQNEGLPPAPIANVSAAAVIAALNPRETDCMFYFHDARAGFHCSETYEEHKALIKKYYGQSE